ncbi:MAG: prepilin-type N-terminal cleavage/methylation domain-containing protein [Bacillota bacterium]
MRKALPAKTLLPKIYTVLKERHRLHFTAGYTLVELIAVLALLGVMTALAVPRFTTLPYWHLEAASRRMAGDLRLLRQEAINSGGQYKAEFYIHLNRYTLTLPQGRRHVYLPDTVQFEGNTTFSGLPPAVHFNYLGRPSSGGTVILKTGDSLRYIIVAPVTGRVRISRTPPQNW